MLKHGFVEVIGVCIVWIVVDFFLKLVSFYAKNCWGFEVLFSLNHNLMKELDFERKRGLRAFFFEIKQIFWKSFRLRRLMTLTNC